MIVGFLYKLIWAFLYSYRLGASPVRHCSSRNVQSLKYKSLVIELVSEE